MDKNAIKKYAVWARTELIDRVRQRAEKYEVAADSDPNADSASGMVLSKTEKAQRQAAIRRMREKGYEHVIEEVAYTWFNRFAALRYMEVNNYLPSRVRVFTDENGDFKPQILTEAIHLNLDGLNMETVYAYKEKNQTDELYKYLLITQCNALSAVLPGMFQKISDYTELLLPDNLLRENSVLGQMVEMIAEDNWTDAVEIIGWLYQYYISEKKDEVFAALKKNVKITRENIPAATQLFTPDWIVKYMVENSLGRLWLERHPDSNLREGWKYYLDEAEQTPEVRAQLDALVAQNPINKPEDIKLIDPCMGSGHILVYAFDVLFQIYQSVGYAERDISDLIIENNIYGLDIDERACQLAYFALMMKARSYNRSFLRRDNVPQPQMYSPQGYEEGMEYGSLVKVDALEEIPSQVLSDGQTYDPEYAGKLNTWNFRRLLHQKYDVVVTNPPYMGSSGMSAKLGDYVKKNYPNSKSDLFAVFIEKCGELLNTNGYQTMITQHAWMFLLSYEKLRAKLMGRSIINMAHLGARAFEEIGGEVVQTTAFVMAKRLISDYAATYARLVDFSSQQAKEDAFLAGSNRHVAKQENFEKITGAPVAYWASNSVIRAFAEEKSLGEIAAPKQGLATTDNNRFVRFWHEVAFANIGFGYDSDTAMKSGLKWFPLNKGGEYRKWYGNNDYIVNYQYDGAEIKANVLRKYTYLKTPEFVVKNQAYYFLENGTWSAISTGDISVRYSPKGFVISNAGMAIYSSSFLKYIIAFMNSKCISGALLESISQTLNFNAGDIEKLPLTIRKDKEQVITQHCDICIKLSKNDWDSFETSWSFEKHPLI